MACCLMAPSHYLNQCWLFFNEILWYSTKGSFTGKPQNIYPWNEFENYQFNIQTTSLRGQWNINGLYGITTHLAWGWPCRAVDWHCSCVHPIRDYGTEIASAAPSYRLPPFWAWWRCVGWASRPAVTARTQTASPHGHLQTKEIKHISFISLLYQMQLKWDHRWSETMRHGADTCTTWAGAHPTNDISIEFEIRSKFGVL